MGCCMSRVPSFTDAPESLADNILPEAPLDETSGLSVSIPIKLVPEQGKGDAIAVYLPNDGGFPSFFFGPAGGLFHMFKIIRTPDEELDRREVATIIGSWQMISDEERNREYSSITKKNEKKLTIKCEDDVECEVKKTFREDGDPTVEIDSGFVIQPDESSTRKVVKRFDKTIAYIYDNASSKAKNNMNPQGGESETMLSNSKAPVVLYLDNMTIAEMYLTLAVIVTSHDRLIPTAIFSTNDDLSAK